MLSHGSAGEWLPGCTIRARIGGGPDSPGYEAFADHLRTFLPLVVQSGAATEDEIAIGTFAARLRDQVGGQQGVLRCLPAIGVWARVPAAQARVEQCGSIAPGSGDRG